MCVCFFFIIIFTCSPFNQTLQFLLHLFEQPFQDFARLNFQHKLQSFDFHVRAKSNSLCDIKNNFFVHFVLFVCLFLAHRSNLMAVVMLRLLSCIELWMCFHFCRSLRRINRRRQNGLLYWWNDNDYEL